MVVASIFLMLWALAAVAAIVLAVVLAKFVVAAATVELMALAGEILVAMSSLAELGRRLLAGVTPVGP